MSEKLYTCICGKEFTNSQSFNSHKSLCKEHYLQKYGGLTEYEAQREKRHKAATESLCKKANDKKQAELIAWIDEQHTCERCGRVMAEKFGSGRFCSRFCANSRDHSDETKDKIRQALVKPEELKKKRVRQPKQLKANTEVTVQQKSIVHKDVCLVCGKELQPKHKYSYCAEHLKEYQKQTRLEHWLETGETGLAPESNVRGIFRDYIMEQQNHRCAICDMPDVWNGKPLVFILDHINGDASYSARENLRLICPNCDSQLDTFKSKNKNSARTARRKYLQEIRDLNK